jgi:hypothetical protein
MPGGPGSFRRISPPLLDSPQKPDSLVGFLESGKGHAAHWPLADIDDRFSELVGVTRAFGVLVCHWPIAMRCKPSSVKTVPPKISLV